MDWRLFLAAIAVIALVAATESPPKKVYLEAVAPLFGGEGSPLDQGPWGTSLLYARLIDSGYHVELSLLLHTPRPGRHVAILAPWPRLCDTPVLVESIARMLDAGERVTLIVFDEAGCPATLAASIYAGVNITVGGLLSFHGLRAVPIAYKPTGLVALGYTVRSLSWTPRDACRPIIVEPYSGTPVGVECGRGRFTLLYIADSHIPTNTLIADNASRAWKLIDRLLVDVGARNATVIIPLELYPKKSYTEIPLTLAIHPAVIAAYIASTLPRMLHEALQEVQSVNPLLPPILAAAVAAAGFAAAAGAAPPRRPRAEKPPSLDELLGGERRRSRL